MKIKNLLLSLCFLLVANTAFADSPLTSTEFHKAYLDVAIIKEAAKSNGIITEKQLQFLTDSKNPIAVKLALINSLGWNKKGKSNAPKYLKYIYQQNPKLNNSNFINTATAEELICYAYLKAMDNYFNTKQACVFARQAMYKAPTSYSIYLIGTLIQVQGVDAKNWCDIYTNMNQIRTNKKLKLDFRPKSIQAVFSYTNGYRAYCN